MYADRTQDIIVQEMLQDFGADVRTDEGSLAYNACVKTASELEDAYLEMSDLYDNMLPDTQDLLHLIRYASERGIEYKYATPAIVRAFIIGTISMGDRFVCQDYVYTVTEIILNEPNMYMMTCDEEGTGANTITGEIQPLDYLDDFEQGEIRWVAVPGTDDEDEEIFRQRIIDSFSALAFGGNKADYRLYIDAQQGVGGCKPKRRNDWEDWIHIWIIRSGDFRAPSNDLVAMIQDLVDPETSHGEGDGMAPICHQVIIEPAMDFFVDVDAGLTLASGYTPEIIQPQVQSILENYFLSLRQSWEHNEEDSIIVRVAQIEGLIINIPGVVDIVSLTLNQNTTNIEIPYTSVPVLGLVTVHN